VLKAIQECDRIGRTAFLQKYGYRHARTIFLAHDGEEYDPRPIYAVAAFHEGLTETPLWPDELALRLRAEPSAIEFNLRSLGFDVEKCATVEGPKRRVRTKTTERESERIADSVVGALFD
jgi:5-methylcytosine-specific restriction protein A